MSFLTMARQSTCTMISTKISIIQKALAHESKTWAQRKRMKRSYRVLLLFLVSLGLFLGESAWLCHCTEMLLLLESGDRGWRKVVGARARRGTSGKEGQAGAELVGSKSPGREQVEGVIVELRWNSLAGI